jgi:hypothetical protein
MFTPAPERGPESRGERWTFALFLVAVLALFTADILTNYAPSKLGGIFVLLFWFPLLATHEFGHALAARLLGWHVGCVVLGFGRTWKCFSLGTVRIEIRSCPITGFVNCVPAHLRQPRLRNALIYFAGPGTDLLVAAAVALLLGFETLLAPTRDVGILALQALALAGAAQGILNLIPCSTSTGGSEIPNDGLGILLSPWRPDSYFAQQIEDVRKAGPASFDDEPMVIDDDPTEWWKRVRRL